MEGIDRHNVYYKEEIKFHVSEISQEVLVRSSSKIAWSKVKGLGSEQDNAMAKWGVLCMLQSREVQHLG
jgi:hypothetical protein